MIELTLNVLLQLCPLDISIFGPIMDKMLDTIYIC